MKKRFFSPVCVFAAAAVLTGAASITAGAETVLNIPIRVEGVDGNIFYETVAVSDDDGTLTASEAIIFADNKSDKLEVKGADVGYITEINGESAGKFGGYDGWYYSVNGEVPSVGITDYVLKDGDSLTVYYGGFPCQIPYVDTDRLSGEGVLVFLSNDEIYDENWNATKVVAPVTEADVTVNGESYKTNDKGEISLDTSKIYGEVSVQITKKDQTGAPSVLRFAPDYTLTIAQPADSSETDTAVSTDTDSEAASDSAKDTDSSKSVSSDKDSDKSSDKDSDKTSDKDSDKASDKDSDKASDSDKGKSTGTTSSGSTSVSNRASNTTAAVSTASAANPQAEAAAATGDDGRTYVALGIFVAAAVLSFVMVVLGKKTEK